MIGQKYLKRYVKTLIDEGNFPRFSIFVGPKGSGKKTFVHEVIQDLNTLHLLSTVFSDKVNPEINLYNTEIDKKEKKTTTELLFTSEEKEEKSTDDEKNNLLFIKNKVKQSVDYLDVIEKFLEEKVSKKSGDDKDAEVLDKISNIVSKLEPLLENEEIINVLSTELNKNNNINSLTNLLEVQLNLSEKIHSLIN